MPADPEAFFTYTDFTVPRRVYRLDVQSAALTAIGPAPNAPDPGRFVSEQVFYASRDGTRVPMTIVRRRDVRPDGRTPTVLYGYGGFNVALLPAYSASRMAWIEAGGIYAQANLRGGGEYGEAWHLAGTQLQQAERLRRLHRRRGVADRQRLHVTGAPGHLGRQQWRACWSAPS